VPFAAVGRVKNSVTES